MAFASVCAFAPAGASAAGWALQNPLTPASSFTSSLQAVSCPAATACTAVGYRLDKSSNSYPVAEGWNGTSWTLESMTPPSGATTSQLTGVSCPAANDCFAVGTATPIGMFTERWNGTSWTLGSLASPPGVAALQGVSCFSSSACTAVGSYYSTALGDSVPLAERWNGTSWSVQSPPPPTGGGLLYSVSCPSATACVATGQAIVGSTAVPFTETWDGTAWTLQTTPNPGAGNGNAQLYAVSCLSASSCEAVGTYHNSLGVLVTLAELWNGSSWSVQSTPNPAKAGESILYGVSCSPDGICTAVGESFAKAKQSTLIVRLSGSGWSLSTPAPNPPGTQFSQLNAASCQSVSVCTAVGYFENTAKHTLVEGLSGTSWTVQTSPDTTGPSSAELLGVSCASSSACIAVGDFLPNNSTAALTLAEFWNGTKWGFQRTVNPTGNTPTKQAIGNRILTAVSCSSATACTAVGFYADYANVGHFPLAELWNGTSWTLQTVPMPTGVSSSGAQLSGVSCSAPGACIAVGYSDLGTFAVRWDGTSWTVRGTQSPGGPGDALSAVSCPSASNCTAVGDTVTSNGIATLAEHWNGTSWTVQSTPSPGGTNGTSNLSGVSCSAAACTAAGYYNAGTGAATLAERWDGTSWTQQTTPNSNTSSTNRLDGVSCQSAGSCSAVGTLRVQTLAEGWDGTSWTLQSTPNLSGQTTQTLAGVSCSSATDCLAVGSGYRAAGVGTQQVLAERYSASSAPVKLSVSAAGLGSGSVSASRIACPPTCSASYPAGTVVTLTATAAAGSAFAGWSGAGCSGAGSCQVQLNADTTVTATFNKLPSCSNLTAHATAGIAASVQLSCADAAGHPLTYAIVAVPAHGTVGAPSSAGTVTYTPNAGYTGADSFTYKATASDGTSNTASVSITVSTVAAAGPSCSNLTAPAASGAASTVQLSCIDPSGGVLTYAIVAAPAHGTVGAPSSSGKVTYTPSAGYSGPDSFTYKAAAPDGTSNTAAVSISVAKPGFHGGAAQAVISKGKLKATAAGKLVLKVKNNNSFDVIVSSVQLTALKAVTARKHGKPLTLGSSHSAVRVVPGGTVTLKIRLKPAAIRLLKRLHRIPARIVIVLTAPDGSTHTIATAGTLHAHAGKRRGR